MDDLTYLFKMANMNEAVISNEEKPIVGTQALATCFGLLLYDENNKTALVAHLSTDWQSTLMKLLSLIDFEKENHNYILSRSPLRRFEGIETKESVKIVPINYEKCGRDIIEILEEIRNENETVQPDDIAIIFLENTKENYELADILEILIKDRFNWEINKGYETKEKTKNCLFVSNKNNVKGLEFPFVICIIRNSLQSDLQMRNSLYMMLTRSFLKSYFLLPETDTNIKKYQEELKKINDTGVLKVKEPTEEEKEELMKTVINYNANSINKSAREIAEEIMDKYEIPVNKRNVLHNVVSTILKDNYSPERIEDVIVQNYNFL